MTEQQTVEERAVEVLARKIRPENWTTHADQECQRLAHHRLHKARWADERLADRMLAALRAANLTVVDTAELEQLERTAAACATAGPCVVRGPMVQRGVL